MTLAHPDKPSVFDKIEDIITDIKENFDSLDNRNTSYFAKLIERNVGEGNSIQNVGGVGGTPRAIFFYGVGSAGESSIGYYGPAIGKNAVCYRRERVFDGGINDQYKISGGNQIASFYYYDQTTTRLNLMIVDMINTYSDGITISWNEMYAMIPGNKYYLLMYFVK